MPPTSKYVREEAVDAEEAEEADDAEEPEEVRRATKVLHP